MKWKITALAILVLMASCCREDGMDKGTITGIDPRDCMCCGGWFVVINGSTYRFDQVPEDCTIDFSQVIYPIDVRLEWTKKIPQCMGDEIVVTKLVQD